MCAYHRADPEQNGSERDHRQVVAGELFVTGIKKIAGGMFAILTSADQGASLTRQHPDLTTEST